MDSKCSGNILKGNISFSVPQKKKKQKLLCSIGYSHHPIGTLRIE